MGDNDDDTVSSTAFTPNCCVLSWRLRLGYGELYATLAPNMINAVITRARSTEPACVTVDELIERCREISKPLLGSNLGKGDFESVIQALMAKLPFDDPDVDAHAQQILLTAVSQFYPEFVLGLGDEATALLPSGGGDAEKFAERMLPDITNLIMRPMARGQELPERLREGTFMTAIATLQGKLLAEPSLAPFTLRADARALARRALWWIYSAPDDLNERQAISAAREAIQARIQREQLNRHAFTYTCVLEQPADATSLRDAYAPYLADDVPWESIEPHLVPSVGSQQEALRREDLLVHNVHADTAVKLCARFRAVARSLEPAKRLCWFMSTVQYSHNAIEEVRLGEGESGDFATFESWAQELESCLTAARGALEICAAASHLGAKGFIKRGTGTWPWSMLLQLFSADDVDDIFGSADAMHALMRDPLFGHSASSWLGESDAPSLSDEAARRRLEPSTGIRLMEWACGLRALFSVPVYAAYAESHVYVKRVLGLVDVQCAVEHVDDSYIATRPWDEVLAMTAYDGGGKGLSYVGAEVGACSRVANGRVSCVHLTYATTDDRYLKGRVLAPVVAARDTCCVCLDTKPLDACLKPCRHKVCGTCSRKLAKCPLCRERVVDVELHDENTTSEMAEAIRDNDYLKDMMNRLQNGLTALRAVARLPRCAREAPPTAPIFATGVPDGLAAATHCAFTMCVGEGGRKVTYWGSCDDVEAMDRAGPSRTPFSVVAVTDVDGAGRRECSAMGCPNRQGGDGLGPFSRCGRCRISLYCSQECQRRDWKHQHREQCPRFCALPRGPAAAAAIAGGA